jgi:DHA1 family tetracycline resistance protein-like MFS transporter
MIPTPAQLDFNRVIPIFLIVFVDVLGLTLILPLLHLYAVTFGATPFEIGLVAAAFPLAQLVGLPVMGALSDRFGRKPLLLISQAATCAGFLVLGLANSLALIVLSRMIDGTFGANIATAQAALSDITDDKTRAQGLGVIGAAFGLGFIFGPLISILVLEFSDNNLAMPAFVAMAYSLLSILLTIFMFRETLPPPQRSRSFSPRSPFAALGLLRQPGVGVIVALLFAQQVIFFGFESLLGLFTLSRLGLLGQGNALIFIIVGAVLVMVQVRCIGPWSRRYGESRLVHAALALLAGGLILFALTPEQPHPLYIQRLVERQLITRDPTSTEALIGAIAVPLPADENRGFAGVLWLLAVIVPIAVGAGLIRPSLNSLLTKQVTRQRFGSALALSASAISLANAIAPLLGGWLFQQHGSTTPFLLGGLVMGGLLLLSLAAIRPVHKSGSPALSDA